MIVVSRAVLILHAADGGEHEYVVELVDAATIVACDACIAAVFEAAVILDMILYQEAIIVTVVASLGVDRCSDVEIAPVNVQTLAVHLCL